MTMEFKFKANIFKNDFSQNKNNNPKFPTHGGTLEMPLKKLEEYVEYFHWAAKTELKSDEYLGNHVYLSRFLAGLLSQKRPAKLS